MLCAAGALLTGALVPCHSSEPQWRVEKLWRRRAPAASRPSRRGASATHSFTRSHRFDVGALLLSLVRAAGARRPLACQLARIASTLACSCCLLSEPQRRVDHSLVHSLASLRRGRAPTASRPSRRGGSAARSFTRSYRFGAGAIPLPLVQAAGPRRPLARSLARIASVSASSYSLSRPKRRGASADRS